MLVVLLCKADAVYIWIQGKIQRKRKCIIGDLMLRTDSGVDIIIVVLSLLIDNMMDNNIVADLYCFRNE